MIPVDQGGRLSKTSRSGLLRLIFDTAALFCRQKNRTHNPVLKALSPQAVKHRRVGNLASDHTCCSDERRSRGHRSPVGSNKTPARFEHKAGGVRGVGRPGYFGLVSGNSNAQMGMRRFSHRDSCVARIKDSWKPFQRFHRCAMKSCLAFGPAGVKKWENR